MKRLLLSTTLILGTLTGVNGSGASHPAMAHYLQSLIKGFRIKFTFKEI